MTIPVVRQRAKHRKTKTGCLTCRQRRVKCDKGRTLTGNGQRSCGNCLRSGRECGGFDDAEPRERPISPSTCPNSTKLALSKSLVKIGLESLDPSGLMALDFFRIHTKSRLPGRCFGASWDRIAMEVAAMEPTIALSLAALGSMHRAIMYSSPIDQQQLAVAQYSRALASARRCIVNITSSRSSSDIINTVLLSSLIFFVFELYCGRDEQAALHLQTGLRILYERTQSLRGEPGAANRLIELDPKPKDVLGVLSQTFVRLDADLVLAGNDDTYLHPVVTEQPLPLKFEHIDEANVFLDSLSTAVIDIMGRVYDAAEVAKRRDLSVLDEDEKFGLIETFGRVCDLPQDILVDGKNDEIRDEHTLTRFFFFYLWSLIETFRDASEMLRDRFDEQYEHLTELAEEYLESNSSSIEYHDASGTTYRTPPAFYLGTGFVTCLNLIAVNCRTSSVRRRCLGALRKINLQGVSDTVFLSNSVECIIVAEEERARKIRGFSASKTSFDPHEVDEEARFLNVILSPNVRRLKFDFYKKDVAHLLYVSYGDGDSIAQLPVRRETFRVNRPWSGDILGQSTAI